MDDYVFENYEQLRAERDWTPEVMGDHIERFDASLAAKYREQYAKSGESEAKDSAPKSRRSAPKSQA